MVNIEDLDFTKPTELCKIMGKSGSDKGNINLSNTAHNYTILYDYLFSHLKDKEIRLFELGLGTNNPNLPSSMGINGVPGASLYGWKEYFPKQKYMVRILIKIYYLIRMILKHITVTKINQIIQNM